MIRHLRVKTEANMTTCWQTWYLEPGDGGEGQLGDDPAVEDGVEHREKRRERKADGKHGLHFDHHLKFEQAFVKITPPTFRVRNANYGPLVH